MQAVYYRDRNGQEPVNDLIEVFHRNDKRKSTT